MPFSRSCSKAARTPRYHYAALVPLTTRIARGFYEDGVWADTGFMPWQQISAVSWKEEGGVTLVLISRIKSIARRLDVPGNLYGQARRVLLDDALSAVDTHTEAEILRALREALSGRTALIASHRISAIRDATWIAGCDRCRCPR